MDFSQDDMAAAADPNILLQDNDDSDSALTEDPKVSFPLSRAFLLTPPLHENAGGLPRLKLSLHSCSLPGSTNAMGIETSIALVLPAREHECNGSFNLGRPPALSPRKQTRKREEIKEAENMKKFKEMEILLGEEIVKRNMERIMKAEIIADIKEAEIEGKFNEEIEAQVMKMHMAMEMLKEVDIEKLNKEYDMKQIEERLNQEMGIEKRLKKNMIKKTENMIEEEMDMKKMKTNMKRMKAKKKRRVATKEVEKEIMKKIKKMIESEYREMMIAEVTKKLKEAGNIMKKVKEAKNREKIKEAEIIKKIKNMIEAECLERMVEEILRKETEVLNIEKINESEEMNTSSTPADSSASRTKQPKIGTVRRAACKLFNTSMERCNFNIGEQQALIVSCDKEEYGDYACGNVLRIWHKLQKKGTKLQEPKDVGEEIIRNLPKSDMIEGTPSLHSFGIITFKISGKWMAKRIHKMLTDGIYTWAPEVSLERAIVDFPSLDIAEGMHMDILRRRYISRSLTRMLQYLQVHVLNSAIFAVNLAASHMDLARNIIKIEERDGEVVIYNKAEGELKLLVKTKSDRGLGNTFKDLRALWYGVEKLKAQRLLYAAKCAKWLSIVPLEPPSAIYVGYRSCNVANYTARDVLECAIQYTFLKTHRMAECTFDIDEMLDEEGNTLLYLLNTQARIRSITNKSRKDIRELKKLTDIGYCNSVLLQLSDLGPKYCLQQASEWISEKDDILKKGEEHFESDIKPVKLFGYIDVADTCGLRSDGWVSTHRPDVSYVHLFRRPWTDPMDIITGGCSAFGVPALMEHDLDFSKFLASKLDGFCGHFTVGSEGGQVRINYILLKDAVDATFEVTFKTGLQNLEVRGSIDAYYEDGFPGKCDTFTKTFYTAPLFQLNSPSILKGGPIQLQKSRMAVPRKGSLKVIARLQDGKSWKMILSDSYNFPSQTNGGSKICLKGTNCSFEVKVNWSYCQVSWSTVLT
ncbi:arginine--tRNA ligase, chloroplastic/mitochondrial [Tanacetum coccineum]